jgi:hypothetical protein
MAGEKYFLFQREPVTEYSSTESNTGDGLSVIAIPSDKIANITAKKGIVVFRFHGAGIYDSYGGSENEGLPNVKIEVACEAGNEVALIEQVLTFISRETSRSIMKFDVVSATSTFPLAKVSAPEDLKSLVPKQPVVLATQVVSNDPANTDITSTTTTTIAGVTFPSASTQPTIDYNDTGFTGAIGTNVGGSHTWTNLGTGGATYDINADTGNPLHSRGRNNNLATDAVTITQSDALHLNNKLTVVGEYTMYMVYGLTARLQMYPIYGSSSSLAEGFGRGSTEDVMSFSFDTGSEAPVNVLTSTTDYDTKASTLQDPKLDNIETLGVGNAGAQICYVWVIRRDKDFNIYIHDYQGDVIGYIPRKVDGTERTDGDLSVDRLGGDGTGTEWKGELARFGVIESDIGRGEAARIARELFTRYNYYSF